VNRDAGSRARSVFLRIMRAVRYRNNTAVTESKAERMFRLYTGSPPRRAKKYEMRVYRG
jgi:hypothetical protein